MKTKLWSRFAVPAIGMLLATVGCSKSEPEEKKVETGPDPEQIVATVDGTSLKWDDMDKKARWLLQDEINNKHLMIPANKMDEALNHYRRRAVSTFVFKTVLLNEAKRLKIAVSATDRAAGEKNLQRLVASKNMTTNEFFNKGPVGPKAMRQEYEDSIIIDKLLYVQIYHNIKVDKKELEEQIGSINATNALIRSEMVKIRDQIVSGKTDFADAARTFSRDRQSSSGGDMGEVVRDGRRLPKMIEKKVFELKAGEVSEVINDGKGYVIYKMISKAPAKEKTATTPAIPETAHLARISMPSIPISRAKIMDAVRKVKCNSAAADYYRKLLRQASVTCPLFPDMKFSESSEDENKREVSK